MALTARLISQLASTSNAATYDALASNNPVGLPNSLLLAFVASTAASPADASPGVTGNGVTWTQKTSVNTSARHHSLWMARGAGATSALVRADFGANNQSGCRLTVVEFLDADMSNGTTSAVVQAVAAQGVSPTTGSVTLSAFRNEYSRPVASFAHGVAEASTVDASPAGYVNLDDQNYSTPAQGAATEWNPSATDTTVTMTWATTTANWTGIAAEIAADLHEITPFKPLPFIPQGRSF